MIEKQMGLLFIMILLGVCNLKPLMRGIPQGPFSIVASYERYEAIYTGQNTVDFYGNTGSNL